MKKILIILLTLLSVKIHCMDLYRGFKDFLALSLINFRLLSAVESNNIETTRKLLSEGAMVNVTNFFSDTPLHIAAYEGHNAVIELLINHGADINCKSRNGLTPLHFATIRGHKELVELLISCGAMVNAKDCDGWTPLHHGAYNYYAVDKDIIELLLENGADKNIKDKNDAVPADDTIEEIRETINNYVPLVKR